VVRVWRTLAAFSYEDRLALGVLGAVSAVGFVGAVVAAVVGPPYLRSLFVLIAFVTLVGSIWLGYYGIRGTHLLRLRLTDTEAALASAQAQLESTKAAIENADDALAAHNALFQINGETTSSEHDFIREAYVRIEKLERDVSRLVRHEPEAS
jgi:hypothetical protein